MSIGEYRVGITFNPSNDDMVNQIKRQAADLIDLIQTIPTPEPVTLSPHFAEVRRLKALAMTDIEGAAMWAVKAATKRPLEEETDG